MSAADREPHDAVRRLASRRWEIARGCGKGRIECAGTLHAGAVERASETQQLEVAPGRTGERDPEGQAVCAKACRNGHRAQAEEIDEVRVEPEIQVEPDRLALHVFDSIH